MDTHSLLTLLALVSSPLCSPIRVVPAPIVAHDVPQGIRVPGFHRVCERHAREGLPGGAEVWGLLPSDPEVFSVLFSPEHRETTVPIWSTNQPYQPEIQLGGMLGLKAAGLCREFGMSTQYWNWHEWGRYPRGIRDLSPTYVCPADIILRLELMGVALGGTWVHVEGGQTYLQSDPREGIVPLANRHRELVYEMVRKNLLIPGAQPAHLNAATVVRSFHPALEEGKARGRKGAYTVVLLDPGYLAPQGVDTTLTASDRPIRSITDLITGAPLEVAGNGCRVAVEAGAFRLLQVEFGQPPGRQPGGSPYESSPPSPKSPIQTRKPPMTPYREARFAKGASFPSAADRRVSVSMIPYYARLNRKSDYSRIWLPVY